MYLLKTVWKCSFVLFFFWILQYIADIYFDADRKQCILICHDWGAIIGWKFVAQYKSMVQKYVMMGGPSRRLFRKLFMTTWDQFKRSWYMLFFQAPILPELLLSADDFASFFNVWDGQFNEGFTEEDFEAYKYVFSRPGTQFD